ncbi:MAG TPA: TonB family protein [Thiobacillus sp.]|nr:MAG: energy transducer TonB [Hydrogenophilales bacterium 16-64-40]OZA34917.1 MAG: energy transducer TonB [Hydrogenophilales bacterium 17-64-65]HQS80981.1 TonB family protein [Thiobacillus sp.]HQT34482.1 TonB family protein [Thiobacillus sp.]
MNASIEEPVIPPRLQRPLAAVWISLGLHAALIALVQVAPPASLSLGEPVIEARLVSTHAAPPAVDVPPLAPEVEMPDDTPLPLLAPSETAEALPVAEPVAPPPAESAPTATEAQPAAPAPAAPQPETASAPPAAPASASGVTITSSVDLTYYSAREVDVHPRALREIVPDYPYDADRQRLSGSVRLQLKLEADGRIGAIEIVSATPPGVFDESAIQAFRDARFAPAQKNGRPVRALVLIEVVYDWEGRQ